MPGLNPASSSHSQSSAPIGDGKATPALSNPWSSFQLAELGAMKFPQRPAVLSSTWEKFRAACGEPSAEYKAARSARDAVKLARERWLGDLRQQLCTYLGKDAIYLLQDRKNEAEPLRKLLGDRAVQDLRSLPNPELQAYILSLRTARDFCELELRNQFDLHYLTQSTTTPVPPHHVNMVLHFLLEDMPKQPTNQIRREVLEHVKLEVSQGMERMPDTGFTLLGLQQMLEKVLREKTLLGQPAASPKALAQPKPAAAAAIDLEEASFFTSRAEVPDQKPLDFAAAKQHATQYLAAHQKFKDLDKAKQDTVLTTVDRTLAQNLHRSNRTIESSKAVKLAKEALKVYTAPLPSEMRTVTRWNPLPPATK